MLRKGWLQRQCRLIAKDVANWPQWMKDAAKHDDERRLRHASLDWERRQRQNGGRR